MKELELLKKEILEIEQKNFEEIALKVFSYQYKYNEFYKSLVDFWHKSPTKISKLEQIPCLPIDFFKYKSILSSPRAIEKVFESSGTTQHPKSKHYITDLNFYAQNAIQIFEKYYGSLSKFHILALLPSYLEQGASSLVYMIEKFMQASASTENGFFLYNHQELAKKLNVLQLKNDRKILLIGVTFALLDFALAYPMDLSKVIIMETGGMKGRRKEMIRQEVHEILQKQFQIKQIHSEYGMTELLSQAYSQGEGIFEMPPTMRILLREYNDPFSLSPHRGLINIIDLANIESCAFLASQDVGELLSERQFRVLGRADNSEQRGCNLMIS
ncbi:MAG: acyltransferase [Raineya sp.]